MTKKTRCPECNGMLVHSMSGTKCNTCGWTPEDDECTTIDLDPPKSRMLTLGTPKDD